MTSEINKKFLTSIWWCARFLYLDIRAEELGVNIQWAYVKPPKCHDDMTQKARRPRKYLSFAWRVPESFAFNVIPLCWLVWGVVWVASSTIKGKDNRTKIKLPTRTMAARCEITSIVSIWSKKNCSFKWYSIKIYRSFTAYDPWKEVAHAVGGKRLNDFSPQPPETAFESCPRLPSYRCVALLSRKF